MSANLHQFTDILGDEIVNSQPISLPSSNVSDDERLNQPSVPVVKPAKYTGQCGEYRSIEEIDPKYRSVFSYRYFNIVQSKVIDDALYSDKSMVVCAPTGSGKTVIFEMAIVQLLMEIEEKRIDGDFKIIYMAPVKSLCTERLTEWYSKFTKLGHLCIEVTGDTNVEFHQLKPYRIIITTPEKWNMITRRWTDHRTLVGMIKLFLIDEVHILNDESRGPVLEAVVSRMKTIEASAQAEHRQQLLKLSTRNTFSCTLSTAPRVRFVAVSATVSNPDDVTAWLSTTTQSAVLYKFGDECRPVKVRRIVEGYPCAEGTSIFKFDIILSYKLWPVIQKYHDGKPTLIFCNTRKSVIMTAETLSRELTVTFSPEQKAKLTALASTIKNKKLQALVLAGVGCHHAGLLFEERNNIENSFRNRDLPILITTTTLAMGVNLPAHLVIIKNTQQYANGAYQEYSISTILQMVGRAGRPQFDTEATAVIMTTLKDKHRYQALVEGCEPLQSYLHKRIAENLNSEAALGTVGDVAQCVQWLRSTFLYVRAGKDPRRYLQLPHNAPNQLITNKIEELCVKAMNGLASAGLITMDETSCIHSTEAGRLMSVYYIDLNTMRLIMKIDGTETLDKLLNTICDCHELSDMHLRMDERRMLNALNRNNKATTIRFPMKGKITTRQMKLNCVIQAVLGCLPIQDPSLNQEAMKVMRIVDRICKCVVAYVTRSESVSQNPSTFTAVLNSIILAKCIASHLWENSPYVSKQLKGIGPTFSTLLASAGKTSFMLLENSHPRDLERIMNKGAPVGNVLRKQVTLLPKYQLTATPSNSTTVCIKLLLLNSAFLSENMEHLTAGVHHKCYVVIGDSKNKLLSLSSFQDKDLINVYDGIITFNISRQYNFEHIIVAHCISTEWVGLDAQCTYTFRELEPVYSEYGTSNNKPEKCYPRLIQPSITDIYQERKRKNNRAITQSKEKKKRDCAIVEKFKILKDSFGLASKEIRKNINQSSEETKLLMNNFAQRDLKTPRYLAFKKDNANTLQNNVTEKNDLSLDFPEVNLEDIDDLPINTEEVDSILNEIEKEISISKKSSVKIQDNSHLSDENNLVQSYFYTNPKQNVPENNFPKRKSYVNRPPLTNKSKKQSNNKSNFSFIEEIERKNMNEDDQSTVINTGFSDDIKIFIQNYLKKQTNNEISEGHNINHLIVEPVPIGNDQNFGEGVNIPRKDTLEDSNNGTLIIHNSENITNNGVKEQNVPKMDTGIGENKNLSEENKISDEFSINTIFNNSNSLEDESNAKASKIVISHSDNELIILSDEENIADLATQIILPLSLDSDNEILINDNNDQIFHQTNDLNKSYDNIEINNDSWRKDDKPFKLNECSRTFNASHTENNNLHNDASILLSSGKSTPAKTNKCIETFTNSRSGPTSPQIYTLPPVKTDKNELSNYAVVNSDKSVKPIIPKQFENNTTTIGYIFDYAQNNTLTTVNSINTDTSYNSIPLYDKSKNHTPTSEIQRNHLRNISSLQQSQSSLNFQNIGTKEENPKFYSNADFTNSPYVRNYSLSRSGVNVSTKIMPDRQICMIKKVTVDLSVTEILNSKNKSEDDCKQSALEPDIAQEFSYAFEVLDSKSSENGFLLKNSESKSLNASNNPRGILYDSQHQDKNQLERSELDRNIVNENPKIRKMECVMPRLISNQNEPDNLQNLKSVLENQIFVNKANEKHGNNNSDRTENCNRFIISNTKPTKNKFICPFKSNNSRNCSNKTKLNLENQYIENSLAITEKSIFDSSTNEAKTTISHSNHPNSINNKPEIQIKQDIKKVESNYKDMLEKTCTSYNNATEKQDNLECKEVPTKEVTIENVLQKYSKLLQSNKNHAVEIPTDETNVEDKQVTTKDLVKKTNSVPKKPRRKYKISDINDNKIPLPDSLSELIASKCENKPLDDFQKISQDIKNRILTVNNDTIDNETVSPEPMIFSNESENTYPLVRRPNIKVISPTMPTLPVKKGLEINLFQEIMNNDYNDVLPEDDMKIDCDMDDYKLDASLLNPRTLLQNIDQEEPELIISPPPEFSHNSTSYSPEKNCLISTFDFDTIDMEEATNLSPDIINFIDIPTDIDNNEEFNKVQVTPTKEMETWTLDTENFHDPYHFPKLNSSLLSSPFSIRRNSSTNVTARYNQSLTQPVVHMNRRILQDFKFTKKESLKPATTSSLSNTIKKWPKVRRF